jgi:hypothetical protein
MATTDSGTVTEVLMLETETSSFDSAEETLREDMLAGRQKKKSDFVHQGEFCFPHPLFVDKTKLAFMYKIGIRILYVCRRHYYFYVKNKSA